MILQKINYLIKLILNKNNCSVCKKPYSLSTCDFNLFKSIKIKPTVLPAIQNKTVGFYVYDYKGLYSIKILQINDKKINIKYYPHLRVDCLICGNSKYYHLSNSEN